MGNVSVTVSPGAGGPLKSTLLSALMENAVPLEETTEAGVRGRQPVGFPARKFFVLSNQARKAGLDEVFCPRSSASTASTERLRAFSRRSRIAWFGAKISGGKGDSLFHPGRSLLGVYL